MTFDGSINIGGTPSVWSRARGVVVSRGRKDSYRKEIKVRYLYAVLLVPFVSIACSKSPDSKVAVDHNNRPIHPDDVVSLSTDAFGCKTKFDLVTAAQQYQKHEFSAWARTTTSSNGCFNRPPDGLKWTIFEIDYPAVSVGFSTAAQYSAAHELYPEIDPGGVYWVPSGFVYEEIESK